MRREVPVRSVDGLDSNLSRPVQLRRIGVPGTLTIPVIEDAGRILLLLRRFAPIAGGQRPVLLPRAAAELQRAVAIPRDAQETHRRRLLGAALGQRKLPPQTLDASDPSLALDRLPKLLIHQPHLRRGDVPVTHGRETEEIRRQLRAIRMKDERAVHPQHTAEQTGFENDIVPGRSLPGFRSVRHLRGTRRPIILSEHECREADLLRELQKPLQRGRSGIERARPRLDLRNVFETPRDGLQQLLLLLGRADEDAGLGHRYGLAYSNGVTDLLAVICFKAPNIGNGVPKNQKGGFSAALTNAPCDGTHAIRRTTTSIHWLSRS